jgi:hypothetical protein
MHCWTHKNSELIVQSYTSYRVWCIYVILWWVALHLLEQTWQHFLISLNFNLLSVKVWFEHTIQFNCLVHTQLQSISETCESQYVTYHNRYNIWHCYCSVKQHLKSNRCFNCVIIEAQADGFMIQSLLFHSNVCGAQKFSNKVNSWCVFCGWGLLFVVDRKHRRFGRL